VPPRYGRFDDYTRIGCAAIAMALRDADLEHEEGKTGIVVSTGYECMQTDMAFYETTLEEDGVFSSPNLFSYTLPGIVLGESAILFKLTGPGFTLGQPEGDLGLNALITSMELLEAGQAVFMAAGWLDAPPDHANRTEDAACGAVFAVLGKCRRTETPAGILRLEDGTLTIETGPLTSILDIFK
jgi:3-oxoacyl-[acyl-carrier-protein] synthase II